MMSPAVAPGTVFQGRYEILAVLGEGGFSVVYKGRQLTTGQLVAIKVMRPAQGLSPAGARRRGARFQREMRFCARLHHPNIVRLIDSGQADEGQLYMVFELVPGQNLADVLAEEGALDPAEARHLMLQILDALSCAHGQGLVHSDLQPDNIMLVTAGARRNALVLDFGLGAILQGAPGQEAKITLGDEILCTRAYAAPEQIRGLPPTARSDLYAWGLVFLECLTGRPVFTGGSLEQVVLEQASPKPIPIPAALAGHPLGAILRRATIKDVVERAATAEGLLRELEACDVGGLSRAELAERVAPPGVEAPAESPREAAEEVTSACPQLEKLPMFGREQELDLLLQRWGQTRQGAGQIVLVTGEPGIGKSRLTLELVQRLRGEAHTCLEARCTPDRRSSTLHPIIEVIERLLDTDDDDASASRLERLEALLARCGVASAETVPLLAALLSIPLGARHPMHVTPPQWRKERTFQMLLSLLLDMAEEQPIVFILEELQWANPTTLEWLGSLIKKAPSARVMVLFTARPDLSPPWPTSGMLHIELGRLDRAHVEQIVEQIADGRALPDAVIEQIVGRADGLPLFAEELSRMVIESGAVRGEGSRCVLVESVASAIALPTTLQDLLRARLDQLGRAKETAQLAAAIGREFSQDVLDAASPLGEAVVQADLDKLVAADLVHRRRQVRGPTHMFKHVCIRDAAYESLPKRARRRAHARIARTLEERFPEIVRARPDVLLLHHAAADQKQQAIVYAERAAERALLRLTGADAAEAEERINQALGWLKAIENERDRSLTELRLNNLLVLAMLSCKGYGAESAAAVQRCQSLSDKLGEGSHIASWTTFMCYQMRGQRREARALAERFVATAERSHDSAHLIWALSTLGECLCLEGRHAEARCHMERALSLYDPAVHRGSMILGGLDNRAFAQSTLATTLYLMGEPERALAEGRAAVAWARDLDHPNTLGVALYYLAMVYYFARERTKVREVADCLTALAERYSLWVGKHGWILRRWAEGDLDGLDLCIEELRGFGYQLSLPYCLSMAAELQAERGQHTAALERLDGCLQLANEMGEMYYVPELYRLKALSLQALGEHKANESEACLRQAIALAREQGARMPELRSTLALCRLLERQSRRDEALALLREVCSWPAKHAAMPELAEARTLLGELTGS